MNQPSFSHNSTALSGFAAPQQASEPAADPKQQAAALRLQVEQIERSRLVTSEEVFCSGFAALDRQLPSGGFVCGELVEWLGDQGVGAGALGLWTAWQATRSGGVVVVIDRQRDFYPPAVAAWGVDLEKLIVIHPTNWSEELWALDQALRCRAVAAVWAPLEQIGQQDFRRLQLAAEQGRTAGMLIRSRRWLRQPSWAHLQLLVQPLVDNHSAQELVMPDRGWKVQITRCRARTCSSAIEIKWSEVISH